jgi:hypothetical protein
LKNKHRIDFKGKIIIITIVIIIIIIWADWKLWKLTSYKFNIIINTINIIKFIHIIKFEMNFSTIKKHICDLKGKINYFYYY